MTRRLVATLALALLGAGALPMSSAYACSCAQPPDEGERTLTGAVFYGDVLRREVHRGTAVYVVAVKRVYAGEVGAVAEVHTSASGASCGLELPSSGPALFFAREEEGRLTGMLCDGSRTAADGPPSKLGAGRPPAPSATSPAAAPAPDPGNGGAAVPVAAAAFAVLGAAALAVPRRRA
jgi:hypothetical protein